MLVPTSSFASFAKGTLSIITSALRYIRDESREETEEPACGSVLGTELTLSPGPTRPPVHRALSIGVRYKELRRHTKHRSLELPGTHHDVDILRDLLTQRFGYRGSDIRIMRDVHGCHEMRPTRKNILREMKRLVEDVQDGDHLVFHFSGHGSQVDNLNGTEVDGKDEVIWPEDIVYNTNGTVQGYIMDDEIHDILVDAIPLGVHFTMIFDCCHSGTAADLPYDTEGHTLDQPMLSPAPMQVIEPTENPASSRVRQNIRYTSRGAMYSLEKGGRLEQRRLHQQAKFCPDVISLSACDDSQVTPDSTKGGIFMQVLAETLADQTHITHEELLDTVTTKVMERIDAYNEKADQKHWEHCSPATPHMGSLQRPDKARRSTVNL
ncbi:hypothetical protein WOLCODRAFT_155910 [Wolfiporia cocos MD-104 SS10]|uniref:Peptidase C14 caspase domain-containing protein n=1 Tax=Wolfiporia cocos (strain MD-104) TaxID=742152 RepID=A0A2H3J0K4_WOLCO|nr:hypothetical protein WOLCODRAFT_155910 [Wolfiporia cocos MD-104 SS10]